MHEAQRLDSGLPPPGTQIGDYRLEGLLGRGGMGVVYRGTHLRTGESVALKTVSAPDTRRLGQIRSEVQALARLNHPGVVRILDHGQSDGRPWYAMDLVRGETLRDVARMLFSAPAQSRATEPTAATLSTSSATARSSSRVTAAERVAFSDTLPLYGYGQIEAAGGRLPETLGVLVQLCQILSYVHGEGIVHRDIKPSNIFLTSDGWPVLVDFGLAAQGGGVTGREVLDGEARFGGSARYMAPEQIRGELLDPRCDLYALGCVMFELITGRPPFDGSLVQLFEQHQYQPAPRLGDLAHNVPPALEQLVSRLLAKQRAARIGHADDVRVALQRCGARTPRWPSPLPRPRTYLYRPPLVGRDQLMGQLQRTLRQLLRRRGSCVFLEGESGVGKTRIALELAQRASTMHIRVVAGGCVSVSAEPSTTTGFGTRSGPLHPLRGLLRAVADACIEGGPKETRRLLGRTGQTLAEFEPALRQVVGESSTAPNLPATAARFQLYRALTSMLAAYSSSLPLMLILDDLQWADELTQGFLDYLVSRRLAALPVLVVVMSRREERTRQLAQFQEHPNVQRYEVERLPSDSVGEMVSGMLALDRAPQALVDFLSARSHGNPFFVTEYLRIATEKQLLVRDGKGNWQPARSIESLDAAYAALPLPGSLHELIEGRLKELPTTVLSIVRLAAVAGREVEPDLLAIAAGVSEDSVLAALADLESRYVMESSHSNAGACFAHDKIRETVYSELQEAERKKLHRKLADALERRGSVGLTLPHGAIGHHWLEAGEPERAVPSLKAAGDAAANMHALDQAIAFYRSGIEALQALPQVDASALVELGERLADTLALTGAMEEARAQFKAAVAASTTTQHVVRARLHRKFGKTWEAEHDHAQESAAYDLAEQELQRSREEEPEGWWQEWIQVQLNRTWVYYWQARVDEMNVVVAAIAPHLQQHASARQRSNYYQALVTRDYRQDRFVVSDQTLEYARLSLAAAQEAQAPVEAALARFVLGFGLLFAERLVDAEGELLRGLSETRNLGDTTNEIRCLAYILLVHRRAQRSAETQLLAREVLARSTTARMLDYVGLSRACLGWLAWKAGRSTEAAELSRAALQAWDELSFTYPFQWTAGITLVAVELANPDLSVPVDVARRLLGAQLARLPSAIDTPLQDARASHDEGDQERARECLRRAIDASLIAGYL